jgi:hypothetical protein
MNSRGFLRFRMLIEFIAGLTLMIAAVDVDRVRISSHVWLDLPCRLLFAILAVGIFADSVRVHRESRAR